jgi:hypothetical protein
MDNPLTYKLPGKDLDGKDLEYIIQKPDGNLVPLDPANTDYQKYLEWVEEGNIPLPADTE